jgi:hypothetical protein
MILAGLNPFRLPARRLAVLPAAEFLGGVMAVKRCIYDGGRMRLLQYDARAAAYRTVAGLEVRVPPMLSDVLTNRLRTLNVAADALAVRPRWIVTDAVRLAAVPPRPAERHAAIRYRAEAGHISVLDGFVTPDLDFVAPRKFAAPTIVKAAPATTSVPKPAPTSVPKPATTSVPKPAPTSVPKPAPTSKRSSP